MKIKTTTVLKNLMGEEMKLSENKPAIFREIVTNLLNIEDNDHRLTAELKNKAFQIMKKLWEGDETDLTIEQRSLIIDRARIFYTTMMAGVIAEYMEE